jgi:YjbE family integral membrane protein
VALSLETLLAALSIVVIDLTLSGDNALIIGMAAHRLDPRQRRLAVLFGAGGAIVLRVIFAALAAILLRIPFVELGGGLLLVWIAFKLLRDEAESEHGAPTGNSLMEAVKVIILADVVMSLDNILAVGGASHGSLELLAFGLALSMPIVMFGSSMLAGLMGRLRWLVYAGALVLAWTSAQMILEDPLISSRFDGGDGVTIGLTVVIGALVVGANQWLRRRQTGAAEGDARQSAESTTGE